MFACILSYLLCFLKHGKEVDILRLYKIIEKLISFVLRDRLIEIDRPNVQLLLQSHAAVL